jgi:hypothetical protein
MWSPGYDTVSSGKWLPMCLKNTYSLKIDVPEYKVAKPKTKRHYKFNGCHLVVLLTAQGLNKSVETQLNPIYYIELHVSTYLRSSSRLQFVFKTC